MPQQVCKMLTGDVGSPPIYFSFNFQFLRLALLMALHAIKMPSQQFFQRTARKLLKIIFYDCHKDDSLAQLSPPAPKAPKTPKTLAKTMTPRLATGSGNNRASSSF